MAKQFRVTFKSKKDRKRAKQEAKRDIEIYYSNVAFKNNLKKCEKEDKKTLIFTVKSKAKKNDLKEYLGMYDCTIEKVKNEEENTSINNKDATESVNYFEPRSFTSCHGVGGGCHSFDR